MSYWIFRPDISGLIKHHPLPPLNESVMGPPLRATSKVTIILILTPHHEAKNPSPSNIVWKKCCLSPHKSIPVCWYRNPPFQGLGLGQKDDLKSKWANSKESTEENRKNAKCKYILLTKQEGRTARISARHLDSTDRAQRGPYKRPRADILSVRSRASLVNG